MFLQQLLNGISYTMYGEGNPNVTSLSCDTSTVKQGCLFFCLKGKKYDGHKFFPKVIGDGAVAIVCEHRLNTQALQIVVQNSREVMSQIAKRFYDNAVDNLQVVSVVGTNGKTTTSYILESILTKAGINTAVVGTNGIFFNGQRHANHLTTPDPIELHYWFKQMYLNKVRVVILEVSAHAIALSKVRGVVSDVAIFTNLSQDHLDFFGDMTSYANTKLSFFANGYTRNAVVNIDDELGKKIAKTLPCVTFGIKQRADVIAKDLQINKCGSCYTIQVFEKQIKVASSLSGEFNVYNTLGATACAKLLGVDEQTICHGAMQIEYVAGRNQTLIRGDGARIVVDFAHTPDGITNILQFLRQSTKGKLIVVFGCGGNRDKLKRPLMAQQVSRFADFAVLTNDNPRYEDPNQIAQDVCQLLTCKHKVILNRSQATQYALSVATEQDTVAILGKGAEQYQEIRGKKIPYDDVQVVRQLLRDN